MRTELGRSQVEVQQCALSWEVGEELGEELARRKWRWKLMQTWSRRNWRRRRRRRRTTALIQSNNPHLTGGEKTRNQKNKKNNKNKNKKQNDKTQLSATTPPLGCAIFFFLFFWFFPTCQVRVVRFYQSALPSRPRPPPPPAPRLAVLFLLVQFLLDHVCINFYLHFRLANSSPSSLPTLFADSLRQALCQLPSSVCTLDLNLGPAQLSVHRWTSTWDLPSSVCHRWTLTWDLPSSVCTAGPQRPDRMPEEMPDRMSDRMSEDMPDKMP